MSAPCEWEIVHVERNHKELSRSSAIFMWGIIEMLKIADFKLNLCMDPSRP